MGNLLVADARNNRIQKIAPTDGEVLTTFGSLGQDKSQFNGPTSVGVGLFDNIYVADRGNNRVQIFDPQGAFIGQFGNPGDAPTQFRFPAGLAVSPTTGLLYVADTENNRVVLYSPNSPDPVPMGQKGSGPDQFVSPGGVAIDKAGNVYVADTGNRRIMKLSAPQRP
jgi:DNA-binding beta-propeller fold protein YncE